uniref:Potassium voltage-gated channel subfamily E regulatory subunit 3 n=1 Tax=Latimeria chalumnae TaxID=7897 RepID=H3A5N8_LATCH|nr:PREDICTED: potassium voltage-gated channel subfamily E member 3 [Latimeria chalumnae]|eukprot:XP_006013221.1 PREDICTED: potassium voltage-gated channel subfamily E member 3 [Latimeria chalumnae]
MGSQRSADVFYRNLHHLLKSLNSTLSNVPCANQSRAWENADRDSDAYIYIIFVMFLFAVTVGGLVLLYTKSRKEEKRADPYFLFLKNSDSLL